jgi:hypothetical protein
VAAGGRCGVSQPYLGPRDARSCPGDMMMDWVSPACGVRPLSLIRPSARPGWDRRRLTAARRELAAVVPHLVSSAVVRLRDLACRGLRSPGGSGGRERAVAELGQDVAGLADDLASFG